MLDDRTLYELHVRGRDGVWRARLTLTPPRARAIAEAYRRFQATGYELHEVTEKTRTPGTRLRAWRAIKKED